MGFIAAASGILVSVIVGLSAETVFASLDSVDYESGSLILFYACCCFTFPALGIFSVEVAIIGAAGLISKRNLLYYFFIEPTVFDRDDIIAMSKSVHKSILGALEQTGIDLTNLRTKQQFKRSRQDNI